MRLRWPSRRGILRRLAILGLVVAWLGVASVIETRRLHATLPGGTRGATNVDVGQLAEDVRRLSAPDMEGRRTGTEGNARARAYRERHQLPPALRLPRARQQLTTIVTIR